MPDLVLVDGGRGQLGSALRVLSGLDQKDCEVAALAKARSADGLRVKEERVYRPGSPDPIPIPELT